MSAPVETPFIARGVLESVSNEKLVLSIPGTSYQLHLIPTVPAATISTPVGKRIKGTVHGKALRIHAAAGGGRFMEPVMGEPRIVAGVVVAVDQSNRRILVDTGVPMWLSLDDRQPADSYSEGQLVNCYVQSGTRFTPA